MVGHSLTPAATRDIEEILFYVGLDNPTAAQNLDEEMVATFVKLSRMPGMGHTRDDLTNEPVRFWPVYSYLIVYDPKSKPLRIIRVISGFRDVKELLADESA